MARNLILFVGLGGFAIAGVGYFTRFNLSDKFSKQKYYNEGIKLFEGYAPLVEKLGSPIKYKKVDISDDFNYHDSQTARVKIPFNGQLRSGELLIYANREETSWSVEKLEVVFKGAGVKYKFYDSSLRKDAQHGQNQPSDKN